MWSSVVQFYVYKYTRTGGGGGGGGGAGAPGPGLVAGFFRRDLAIGLAETAAASVHSESLA